MKIDVVIVTYNRLEKLKKTLECYAQQTKPFRNLVVVNNHSTDGTADYLEAWQKTNTPFEKHVLNTEDNLGGAGGFYLGEKKAMAFEPDWIFIADDDAYPEPDLMEQFYNFSEQHPVDSYSAVCAAVMKPDGDFDLCHRSRYEVTPSNHFIWESAPLEDYKKSFFKIDFLSYVGPFINAKAIKKVGCIDPRFFIYNDDSEHSLRLKKYGEIICVPSIRIVHDVKTVSQFKGQAAEQTTLVSWGDYYSIRNEMVMLKRHLPKVAWKRFKSALKRQMKGKNTNPYDKITWIAIRDAWLHRMGKHPVYKPGWSINENKSK